MSVLVLAVAGKRDCTLSSRIAPGIREYAQVFVGIRGYAGVCTSMCEYMREMREHGYAWVCGFMCEYIAGYRRLHCGGRCDFWWGGYLVYHVLTVLCNIWDNEC